MASVTRCSHATGLSIPYRAFYDGFWAACGDVASRWSVWWAISHTGTISDLTVRHIQTSSRMWKLGFDLIDVSESVFYLVWRDISIRLMVGTKEWQHCPLYSKNKNAQKHRWPNGYYGIGRIKRSKTLSIWLLGLLPWCHCFKNVQPISQMVTDSQWIHLPSKDQNQWIKADPD